MELARSDEGRTKLMVPKASLSIAPPSVPVFYNPAASINRSVSVALAEGSEGRTFCDALAGIGARGVRVATEVTRRMEVTMVDLNTESIGLGRKNARLNRVSSRCTFVHEEGNSFLHSRYGRDEKFDFVDVDPFGTPVPFVQAALKATKDGGTASFTATDTAVLCGVHQKVAERRYGGTPLNNHFHHETGIRLLLDAIRREAASLDLGIRPIAAHSTRHYMRVYVRVEVGPTRAEASRASEGYVVWCRSCGTASVAEEPARVCKACGSKAKTAGPLWKGKLTEEQTLEAAITASHQLGLADAGRALAPLVGVDEFPPWSFSIEGICSVLHTATVPDDSVETVLRKQGFRTMRQPFEKTGLKTDAGYKEVAEAVAFAARTVRDAKPTHP